MNGNNSWQQRAGQFARFPEYNLGPIAQRQSLSPGGLVSMGQLMEGGGIPAPAMMPQQQMPRQQDYDEGQPPIDKKILGMPKDRFIALMGTIAQAFGGDSPSGRMGAGLINMADIMHQERMGQAETRAAEVKAKRAAAAGTAKERRAAAVKERERLAKVPSGWEVFYREKKGQIDPETKRPFTEAKIYTDFKRIGTKKPAIPKGQAGFEQIEGEWHKGFWHLDTEKGEYIFAPTRKATKPEIAKQTVVKPPVGEKAITPAEKRAQRKELRGLHATILGAQVDKKTGKSIPNIEYPEVQISIDSWNKLSNKPFVYQLIPGTPKQAIDWGRDIPATPAKLEEVDVSTAEKVKSSNLSHELKVHLLKTRFGYE